MPQIEVTFDIDANGILNVSAADKATGRDAHITITASSGLSENEIEQMVKDAEQHADEDRQHKEEVEARNTADQAVYTAEKTLRDLGDKVPENVRKDVEAKAEALKQIKDTGSVAGHQAKDARAGRRRCSRWAPRPMSSRAARAHRLRAAALTCGGSPPPDEDVVDGEFSEA